VIFHSTARQAVARALRTRVLRAASLGVLVSCGGGGGNSGPTTPKPVLTSISVTLASNSVTVGTATTATAAGLDQNNASIAIGTVSWTTGTPSVATITSAGQVSTIGAGTSTIIATVGAIQGSATLTVNPPPVATVNVTPATATILPGGTQQFAAATLSSTGAALTGRTVTWSSSDLTKASVDAAGLVSGVAQGTATITATSEGISGTATVTVLAPAPVASVTIAPLTTTLAPGANATFTATARDALGNVLTGRVYSWTSSNTAIVSGTSAGSVFTATAVAAGTATITATSEGRSGTATVTVVAVAASITSVTPGTLVPGSAMTITGVGFSPTTSGNTVSVHGAAATVTSASTTQLVATVPCVSSGTVPVVVTANSLASNSVNATLAVTTRTLAVGQTVQLLDEASTRCNELSVTGGKYLISVFNSSTVPLANSPVVISGVTPSAIQGAALSVQPLRPARAALRGMVETDGARDAQRLADARAHAAIMERNREIYVQLRSAPGLAEARAAARARMALKSVVIPLTVGSTVTMNNRGLTGSCNNSTLTSTARVVAVNARSILLEDNASPTAGQVDPELIALGQIFETSQYSVLANFGDINAYDAIGGLNNPGRVVMFFTPTENVPFAGGGFVLGHVTTCDFIPPTVTGFGGSNFTKIFYARVPTILTGSATTLDTKAWWNSVMPGTLVHESKHLTAFAERLARNASALEESWLEEGTAQLALELYSRSVYTGVAWKGNATYLNSVWCDVHRATTCPNGQNLMNNPFNWLYSYYRGNEVLSVLSPGSADGTIYGSAWMFSRWLVDQYGGATESTLLRSLVQEANLTGVNNVTAKTGQSFTALLADWTMMLIADDYPGFTPAAGAKYTFPSWDTRSIWTGYNTDLVGRVLFPLNVNAVTFGSFSLSGTLAGAAAGLIEMSGTQTSKQLLNLSGLPAGTTIRLSILRVQ
jgi:Bacterial Ig-like domain (group 2)/IPT/TIG domain